MSKEEISVNEKFIKNISIILSQYRSEQMSESVKRGMWHRVTSGYSVSRPPLGYSTTETPGLFKVNRCGRALRETLKKLANGETNIESATFSVAMMLWGSTIKSWNTIRTKRLMSDPYYAGYISYKGQLFKGLHEPLVTDEEHKNLLALLKSQNDNNSLKSIDKNL